MNQFLNKKSRPTSNLQLGNCKVLEKPVILSNLGEIYSLAHRGLNLDFHTSTVIYNFKRYIVNQEIVTSTTYNREKKRSNCTVILKNGPIFLIENLIGLRQSDNINSCLIGRYYLLKKKSLRRDRKLDHLISLDEKLNILTAVESDMVLQNVMIIKLDDNDCVAYAHSCSSKMLS